MGSFVLRALVVVAASWAIPEPMIPAPTLSRMTGNLRNTAQIANQISNGDLTVSPKPLSEKDTLGIAL